MEPRADGKQTEVATKGVDTDDRVGMLGPLSDNHAPVLQTSQQYGIYGTALLNYHAKHIRGTTPDEINAAGTSKELKLEIVPKVKKGEVELTVLWDGKPLAGADTTVLIGDKDPLEQKTDKDGLVSFKPEGGGLVGVLANTLEKDKNGELDGKPYKGVMHYATLTFSLPSKDGNDAPRKKPRLRSSKQHRRSRLAHLQLRSYQNPFPALAASLPMVGCTCTAVTRAKSMPIRPRISRTIFVALSSMVAPSGKNCRCKRHCRACRSSLTGERCTALAG